jgi:c-di-GMP-binding flagellar brake protein YcgR
MSLSELERNAIITSCQLNDNLTLNVHDKEDLFVYKSRFFEVDFKNQYIIIDQPSADTPDAKPLAKGESFEVFFEYKTFRYLFNSRVLDHTRIKLNESGFYALKIQLPTELQDGEKREYFRVQTSMRPPVTVKFNIFEKGSKLPVLSTIINSQYEEFRGELVDISGGGFAMRGKIGDKALILEKGDIINARVKLKSGYDEMEIWSEVRNKRKYKDTDISVWGFQFMEKEKNPHMRFFRNKILRYVTERQREILAK